MLHTETVTERQAAAYRRETDRDMQKQLQRQRHIQLDTESQRDT